METFTAPDPLNGETLRAEIEAAGITVGDERPALLGTELRLDVTEADRTAVQQVLDAHTGAPSPRAINGPAIREAARNHLADLRTIRDSSGNLSAAQASNALRALAKGQIHIIRLVLGELNGTD